MMTRTRSSAKTATEKVPIVSTAKTQLSPESANPPKVFVLPKNISSEARVITLCNPRTSNDERYLVCPEKGFHQFTKAAASRLIPRSWLLSASEQQVVQKSHEKDNDKSDKKSDKKDGEDLDYKASTGYVTKTTDLFITTPIDPLFLMLPVLAPQAKSTDSKQLFLSVDDYFDKLITASPHLQSFLQNKFLRSLLEARMSVVCDKVDAGDESMYRLNPTSLLNELLSKATALSASTLPTSMESALIREALRKPVLSLKRGETSHELEEEESTQASGTQTPATTVDSQETPITSSTSFSSDVPVEMLNIEDAKPNPLPIDAPDGIPELLRLRTAFDFILSSYLPPYLASALTIILPTITTVDFSPLDAHLSALAALKQEALASRSLNDFSRKRGTLEDEEAGERRLAKKKKLEEEEKKKKAGESRGVRDLKKVNVKGMKKMSDFFKPKV